VAAMRAAFVETSLFTGALWTFVTLGIAIGAPIVLLIAFPDYQAAIPMIFPLLLQSMGVGLGIGIGPILRTLKRLEFPIVMQIVFILLIVPMGLLLVNWFGEYGAAWLIGLQEIFQVGLMFIVILWLTRPQSHARI